MLAFPPGMRLMASPCTMRLEPHHISKGKAVKGTDDECTMMGNETIKSEKRLFVKLSVFWSGEVLYRGFESTIPCDSGDFLAAEASAAGWRGGCLIFSSHCVVTRASQNVARPNVMRMGINSWGNVLGAKLSFGKSVKSLMSSFDKDRKEPDRTISYTVSIMSYHVLILVRFALDNRRLYSLQP